MSYLPFWDVTKDVTFTCPMKVIKKHYITLDKLEKKGLWTPTSILYYKGGVFLGPSGQILSFLTMGHVDHNMKNGTEEEYYSMQ